MQAQLYKHRNFMLLLLNIALFFRYSLSNVHHSHMHVKDDYEKLLAKHDPLAVDEQQAYFKRSGMLIRDEKNDARRKMIIDFSYFRTMGQ